MSANKKSVNLSREMAKNRIDQAKLQSALFESDQQLNPDNINNTTAGLYGKGFSHDATTGIPSTADIDYLKRALVTGNDTDFDLFSIAGTRKLENPQGAISFEGTGADPEGVSMPVCPALDTRAAAAEMMEVYLMCALRDRSFGDINSSTADTDLDFAVTELNKWGDDILAPKQDGVITRKTLFRGTAPGCTTGAYVSQFLLHPINLGAHTITQQSLVKTGTYGITASNWLSIQQGNVPVPQTTGSSLYTHSPRVLGSFVHIDFVYQAFLYAAAILAGAGASRHSAFTNKTTQTNFVTNGGVPSIAAAVGEISRHALKASWVQKWIHHMRLRPETHAGRVVKVQQGDLVSSTLHAETLTTGLNVVNFVSSYNQAQGGDNLPWLPLQYAEGSPMHPSYPAGHAAIAGACATILKLFFADASWSSTGLTEFESADGSALTTYAGDDAGSTTIHGEINKLASNMSLGRNMAGVHFRSDGDYGMILGEKLAIRFFKNHRNMENQLIGPVTITKFDGSTEII